MRQPPKPDKGRSARDQAVRADLFLAGVGSYLSPKFLGPRPYTRERKPWGFAEIGALRGI
jgi:hypothetical protein